MFHEPFVTFGYLAACTERIEMVTTVLVVSQRQTALVAKQAAQVAVLSGGRLRLGVGTGWNEIEYEALGEEFKTRGARQEEQVRLMRELWTQDAIQFEGRFHTVSGAGINPRPARLIPIWFGGGADVVLDRCARLGDGWMPLGSPNDKSKAMVDTLRAALERAGREPDGFGIQAQAQARGGNPDRWRDHAKAWKGLGATHLAIATMNAGFKRIDEHVDAMRTYKDAVQ
jgi:probable F420-dependent oxidoreductase